MKENMRCNNDRCCCSNKCSSCESDHCNETIKAVLDYLESYCKCAQCSSPLVTIYLNSPGTPTITSTVTDFNLKVSENAEVVGSTGETDLSLDVKVTIPAGEIEIESTGTIDIPGLTINPDNVQTIQEDVDVYIESTGEIDLDLSNGSAQGEVGPLNVVVTVPGGIFDADITSTGTVDVNLDSSGDLTIPELCIQCTSGNTKSDTCQLCSAEGGCCSFYCHTVEDDVKVYVNGTGTFPLDITSEGTVEIPEREAHGVTDTQNLDLVVTGTVAGTITVNSVPGSHITIPPLGVRGTTEGAEGIEVHVTGTNEEDITIDATATGTLQSLPVTGTAFTEGIPVTGTINVASKLDLTPVNFTGTIISVDCGIVVLKEQNSSREIVISICDILKVVIHNSVGIDYISEVTELCVSNSDCTERLQKRLKRDSRRNGTIELYGSSTNNPLTPSIATNKILWIGNGILIERIAINPATKQDTVYSLCEIAAYTFTPVG